MNLSGIGINKTFKTILPPGSPYFYINASLDLANAVYDGTYYFNLENNYSYAKSPSNYGQYHILNDNVIISEVVVKTNPDILTVDDEKTFFEIGGAADYSSPVSVLWAAPAAFGPWNYPPSWNGAPYFNGYPLTESQMNAGSVNYFGHEAGHFPYFKKYNQANPNPATALVDDASKNYKYLAVTVKNDLPNYPVLEDAVLNDSLDDSKDDSVVEIFEERSVKSSRSSVRERKRLGRGLPVGDKAVLSGVLNVSLKVYKKSA
jgi:hypothetical protein